MERHDGSAFEILGVVSLGWDPSCQSVAVTWHGAVATAGDFDALLAAEIKAIEQLQARNLLADCRQQPELPAAEQDRADERWLPAAVAAGLRRFAVVLPRHREAAVNVEDRLGRVSRDHLEVGFFDSLDAARGWLSREPLTLRRRSCTSGRSGACGPGRRPPKGRGGARPPRRSCAAPRTG